MVTKSKLGPVKKETRHILDLLEVPEIPARLKLEAAALVKKAVKSVAKVKSPFFIHLCGVPGSGKSKYSHQMVEDLSDTFLLRFDDVMESLSGYQKDFGTKGPVQAFEIWELPARTIGYHLLAELVSEKRNVLFDHSAAFRNHVELLQEVKHLNFRVEMHYLLCETDIARKRVRERNASGGRFTPERLVGERYELLQELIPQYKAIVDSFEEISSSQ